MVVQWMRALRVQTVLSYILRTFIDNHVCIISCIDSSFHYQPLGGATGDTSQDTLLITQNASWKVTVGLSSYRWCSCTLHQ